MKTGAIILAATKSSHDNSFSPLLEVDGMSVIRRIAITLNRAGISPITVITGERAEDVEKEVSKLPVICLRNPEYKESYMFDNLLMGLRYMDSLCERAFILPAKFPILLSQTVERMMAEYALCVRPVFQEKKGHPILLHHDIFADILSYNGENGLRGALSLPKILSRTALVNVSDEGIILTAEEAQKNVCKPTGKELLPVYPSAEFMLRRDEVFFTPETARLLSLIAHTGSMQTACRQMNISYSKGWKMVKSLEKHLDFPIVATHTGGSLGGASRLTPEGAAFLQKYARAQERLSAYAAKLFKEYF